MAQRLARRGRSSHRRCDRRRSAAHRHRGPVARWTGRRRVRAGRQRRRRGAAARRQGGAAAAGGQPRLHADPGAPRFGGDGSLAEVTHDPARRVATRSATAPAPGRRGPAKVNVRPVAERRQDPDRRDRPDRRRAARPDLSPQGAASGALRRVAVARVAAAGGDRGARSGARRSVAARRAAWSSATNRSRWGSCCARSTRTPTTIRPSACSRRPGPRSTAGRPRRRRGCACCAR